MIDPTATTALHSFDFGSVYTPDGREHPITSFSLPFLANLPTFAPQPSNSQPSSSDPVDPPTTYPATGPNTPAQNASFNIPFLSAPSHFGARLVVGLVGIVVLAIVVARLLK